MSKTVKQLGIFGLGAFGQLIVRHLSPYFEILVCDPSLQARRFARHHNVRLTDLETVAKCPYIVLATPIRTLFDLSRAIAPFVQPRAMVFDVGSVKIGPAKWLSENLPSHCDIICTHPLFGPQSAKRGLHGLEITVCPVRARHLNSIIAFFAKGLDLKVSITSPEAHDEALAAVQGLTHMIAKVLSRMEPLPKVHTTRSYELLLEGIGLVSGDSDELFLSIERDNPYATEVRKRFFSEIEQLKQRLEDAHNAEA